MNAYDRLLVIVSDMIKDAYHLDRHAPSDYRDGDFTPYAPDEVNDRLAEPIRDILREVRERLLKEAEYERSSGRSYQREQRALTWSAAAELLTEFCQDFEFTDSPDVYRAAQWWRESRTYVPNDRQEKLYTLGDNIREARRRAGISRDKLAERLQVTKEDIRILEFGESETLDGIRLDNRHPALRWIAYYLGILIWDVLVFRDGDVERNDT